MPVENAKKVTHGGRIEDVPTSLFTTCILTTNDSPIFN
jgi:hypothetical protein